MTCYKIFQGDGNLTVVERFFVLNFIYIIVLNLKQIHFSKI